MGHILGIRGFKLDTMGRLTGYAYPVVWTPGENVSVCRRKKVICSNNSYSNYHDHTSRCYTIDPCDGKIEDCVHGFWAYFDDFDTQAEKIAKTSYSAVIRGYGRTVIGDKGFRSEKAEILAVSIPFTYVDSPTPRAMVRRNYPDIKVFDTKSEMLQSYPAQDLTPKQPTDPKDPAFWTFDPTSKRKIVRRTEMVSVLNT